MVSETVFSMGGSSGVGSSGSEATKDVVAATSTAKDEQRDDQRSSKFGFLRNLLDRNEFLTKIRQKDIVWGGATRSKAALYKPEDAHLFPARSPSHVPSESDIDSCAAVFEEIIWEGDPETRNERIGTSIKGNQEPNSENPVIIPLQGFLSKHTKQSIGENGKGARSRSRERKQKVDDKPSGKRSRGRKKIDDETLPSLRSMETRSSRRSFSTPRSVSGNKSSFRTSLTRRREDDASSANRVALTAGHHSTAEGENDRDARSSSLGRHESSSRRPLESPRKRTEKLTDSPRLTVERPPESTRKKTKPSRKSSLDSLTTPTSSRKNIGESPPPTQSPRKRTENPTDSRRLAGDRQHESPRKKTGSSRRLSLDSLTTPTSPRKNIGESPPPTDSPRKRTEKPTDSRRLGGERPPESPRKQTGSSKRLSLDSLMTPTSPRKKSVESPPPTESPRERSENPTDSSRLGGERPPESQRKRTGSTRRLSLDSPRKTPSSPRKRIAESPRKTTESQRKTITSSPRKTPDSRRNRVFDSPKKSASDPPKKTSSILLTGKGYTKKGSPSREKSESPRRKVSFSPIKSTSRLTLADQSLLQVLTQKFFIDNIDDMAGPETMKTAKTNEVIKKNIQEEVAVTGEKQKNSTPKASPAGSSSPNSPSRDKPVSPRKLSLSPRKSTSRLTPADQSLLEGITRKLLIDSMDDRRGPETFKSAKTNEVIKKHIQEVAMTGAKQNESVSSTPRASSGGSSSAKELNRRTEESKSWDQIVRQIVSEHCDSRKSVARTEITRSEARGHRLQTRPSGGMV